jgi:hypothetical protein
VLGGEFREVGVRQPGRFGHDDSTCLQAARRADLATVVHDAEVYWTSARDTALTDRL